MSEETTTRKKKSANYALEVYGEKSAEGQAVWLEVQDGFVSPEKALDFVKEKKIQGAIRVVRIASPVYGGSVVVPEPVYTLKKIEDDDKPKTRKPRQPKTVTRPPTVEAPPAAAVPAAAPLPPEVVEALPPDEGLNPDDEADADATP